MNRLSLCLLAALATTAPLHAAAQASPATAALSAEAQSKLDAVLKGAWRSADNVARDRYRNPAETLAFFGITPGQTVIEIAPGGGWYSEILSPYLHDSGQYIASAVDPATVPEGRSRENQQRSMDNLQARLSKSPAQYGKARVVTYNPAAPVFGSANSADAVLTFRSVHNWRGAGQAEGMFEGFYNVLKPGGVLGVVEHRAKADVPADDRTGYVGQDQVIAMAEAAGFRLAEASEINANPLDTKDHPNGVWTLPPVGRHDAADAAKYKAIGESDRMTLRFVKP